MKNIPLPILIGCTILFFSCTKNMQPDAVSETELKADKTIEQCSEKIIFFSSRTNNGDLYSFNPLSLETSEFIVADSALGGQVFNKFTNSLIFAQKDSDRRNLYSKNINSGKITFLMPNPAGDEIPDWSPLANKIVYSFSNESSEFSLIVEDLTHGEKTLLYENATQSFDPVWSPDGLRIAFVLTDSSNNADIAVIDPDGTNFTNLTKNSKLHGHPNWSPNGKNLLFYIYNNGNADLYSLEVETKDLTQLTFDNANQLIGRYSSNGQKIAYGGIFENDWEVFIMDADGNNKERITFNPGFDGDPVWIPCN